MLPPPPALGRWAGRKRVPYAPPWPPSRGPPPRTPVTAMAGGHPQRPELLQQPAGLLETPLQGQAWPTFPRETAGWRAAPSSVGTFNGQNLSVWGQGRGGWEKWGE